MKFFLLIIIFLIILSFLKSNNIENMCAIEYPVCDNYCQKAKLDLCIHKRKNGEFVPWC